MNRNDCNSPLRILQAVVVLTTALVLVGCGTPVPDIVPISGTVTINDKPIANVEVKFIPNVKGLDGNMTGSGVTDSEGKYTIFLPGKTEAGGCACNCKVTLTEGPIPDEFREAQDSQIAVTNFMRSLKNRPIPQQYTRMGTTPLSVNVTADQPTYDFKVKR